MASYKRVILQSDNISDLTNDAGYITSVGNIAWGDISGKPSIFMHDYATVTGNPVFAGTTVFTGSTRFQNTTTQITSTTAFSGQPTLQWKFPGASDSNFYGAIKLSREGSSGYNSQLEFQTSVYNNNLRTMMTLKSNGNLSVVGNVYTPNAEISNSIILGGSSFTSANVRNWNVAYNWGDHSTQGYITTSDTAPVANIANRLNVYDTRSNLIPPYNGGRLVRFDFKANSTDGLNDGSVYHGVMQFNPWSDDSGGKAHQVGFTYNNNIYVRTNANNTTWNSWSRLAHASEIPSLSGYATLSDPTFVLRINTPQVRFTDSSKTSFNHLNVAQWSTAYNWGNHADAGYSTFSGSYDDLTNKPSLNGNIVYNQNIQPVSIRQYWADSTPAGVQFNNAFSAPNGADTRAVYFDGGPGASSVSTWYGVANKPFSAIDVSQTYLSVWTNSTDGTWKRMLDVFGNHSLVRANVNFQSTGIITASGGDSTSWNTAYGWGNHASQGYLTSHQSLSAYAPIASPTFTGHIRLSGSGRTTGGFGAVTTAGTTDWNHDSNAISGQGYTLLTASATNGHGFDGDYYHPFNWEYARNDGQGNMTQLAVPYSGTGAFAFRTRYSGVWTSWRRIIDTGIISSYADKTPSWVPSSNPGYSNLTLSGVQSYIEGDDGIRSVRFDFQDYGPHWNTNDGHSTNNPMSIKLWDSYADQAESNLDPYGTILDIYGRSGHERDQLFFGNTGRMYHRNVFYGTNTWNSWKKIWDNSDLSDTVVDSLKTNYNRWLTSHQDLSNYATLNGSQTFTGGKNFTSNSTFSSNLYVGGNLATDNIVSYRGTDTIDIDAATVTVGGTGSQSNPNKLVLRGHAVPYSGGGHLAGEGFLQFDSNVNWTGGQRRWAITNAWGIGINSAYTGNLTFLVGTDSSQTPTIGLNGALGTAEGQKTVIGMRIDGSGVIHARTGNSDQWNTAYGWGNHASSGYLTSHQDISGKANLSGASFTGEVSIQNPGKGLFVQAGYESPYTQNIAEFKYGGNSNSIIIKNVMGQASISTSGTTLQLCANDVVGLTLNTNSTATFANAVTSGSHHPSGYSTVDLGHSGAVWRQIHATNIYTTGITVDGRAVGGTTIDNIGVGITAHGWGNHASAGYYKAGSTLDISSIKNRGSYTELNDLATVKKLYVAFPHGVANQKADIVIPNTHDLGRFWGEIIVTINSGYSHENASGSLKVCYALGINHNGAEYTNTSMVMVSEGATPNNYALDDAFRWDATNKHWYLTIQHSKSTGNQAYIQLEAKGTSSNYLENIQTAYVTSVYTTNTNVFPNRGYEYNDSFTINGGATINGDTYINASNLQVKGVNPQFRIMNSNNNFYRQYVNDADQNRYTYYNSTLIQAYSPVVGWDFRGNVSFSNNITVSTGQIFSGSGSNLQLVPNTGVASVAGQLRVSSSFTAETNAYVASNLYTNSIQHNTAGTMTIGNGNHTVLIDTGQLDLRSSGDAPRLKLVDNNGTDCGSVYAHNGNQEIGFLDRGSAWAYKHKHNTHHQWRINNSQRMFLDSDEFYVYPNGTVMLGVTTDGVRSYGTVTATGGNSTNWNTAYGWGDHSRAGYSTGKSDIRLKKDVKTVDKPLEKLSKLRGVDFTWKDTDKKGGGVIAQEVEKVLPDLVEYNVDVQANTVDYNGLIGVLIESVKELKNEVETLKAKCNCKGEK